MRRLRIAIQSWVRNFFAGIVVIIIVEPVTRFAKLPGSNKAGLVLLGIGAVIVLFGYVFSQEERNFHVFVEQVYSNLGIELISIGITVLIIENLNRQISERDRKAELILQMGSPDNAFAVEAVRILRSKHWLTDGSLEGADLQHANLQGADLQQANLQGADFRFANLQGAKLSYADLRGADLVAANLQQAKLYYANLRGASLQNTKLQGADLMFAFLQGTDLSRALFDQNTILSYSDRWWPGRDLREFTHPDEWYAEQKEKRAASSDSQSASILIDNNSND
jgi:Pentapeptide repeats (8 copies)